MKKPLRLARVLAIGILLATLAGTATGASPNPGRLNVVFILIDDLGWKDLGYMGSQFYESPAIDQLASDGLRFTRAYEAAPRCVQSRRSILTGKDQNRPELVGPNGLQLNQMTLGKAFQQQGYQTFYAGKWHEGGVEALWPQHQGFEINKGGCALGALGSHFWPYTNPDREPQIGPRESHNVVPYGLEQGHKGEYISDRLTDETVSFLRARKAQGETRPFFIYLSHYLVHEPLEGKPELVKYFTEKLKAMPPLPGPDYENDYTGKVKLKQDLPVYAAMVKSMDESVQRVRQTLAELGYEQNTAIVFTSDNGGLSTFDLLGRRSVATSNKPLRTGKGWLYEGGMRVPLIVYWPGVTRPGTTTDRAVVGTDFFPTFLEMAGLPLMPDCHVDGESFLAVLRGDLNSPRKAPVHWFFNDAKLGTGNTAMAAMLDGDMKLIKFVYENRFELYNLREDIGEHHDLSVQNPAVLNRMKEDLGKWEQTVGVKPLNNRQIETIKGLLDELHGKKAKENKGGGNDDT